jgi:hypothetical protein
MVPLQVHQSHGQNLGGIAQLLIGKQENAPFALSDEYFPQKQQTSAA